jgi:hypothetical protein
LQNWKKRGRGGIWDPYPERPNFYGASAIPPDDTSNSERPIILRKQFVSFEALLSHDNRILLKRRLVAVGFT